MAGVAAFVGPYAKNAGGLSNVPEAIMTDVKNFKATEAMDRLKIKDNQKEIALPLVGGVIVKIASENLLKGKSRKAGQIAGKTAVAYGVGKLAKVILDPPPEEPIRGVTKLAPPGITDRPINMPSNPYDNGGY